MELVCRSFPAQTLYQHQHPFFPSIYSHTRVLLGPNNGRSLIFLILVVQYEHADADPRVFYVCLGPRWGPGRGGIREWSRREWRKRGWGSSQRIHYYLEVIPPRYIDRNWEEAVPVGGREIQVFSCVSPSPGKKFKLIFSSLSLLEYSVTAQFEEDDPAYQWIVLLLVSLIPSFINS